MSLTALSIIQPWPWLILRPDVVAADQRAALRLMGRMKDVENRDWVTAHRGWVLVHASGTRLPVASRPTEGKAKADWQSAAMFAAKRGVEIPLQASLDHGAIVGAMRIDGCEPWVKSPWFTGSHGLVIGEAVPFARAIPMKGALKFFPVPAAGTGAGGLELVQAIHEQIHAAGLAGEFRL